MIFFSFFLRKDFYVEKGFPCELFFQKNTYNPIVQKSGCLKLALMCICPHSPAGVAISGISLHQRDAFYQLGIFRYYFGIYQFTSGF